MVEWRQDLHPGERDRKLLVLQSNGKESGEAQGYPLLCWMRGGTQLCPVRLRRGLHGSAWQGEVGEMGGSCGSA